MACEKKLLLDDYKRKKNFYHAHPERYRGNNGLYAPHPFGVQEFKHPTLLPVPEQRTVFDVILI